MLKAVLNNGSQVFDQDVGGLISMRDPRCDVAIYKIRPTKLDPGSSTDLLSH